MVLYLTAIGAGLLFGLFMGGSVSKLARFPLHYSWLVIVSTLVQVVIFSPLFEITGLPVYSVPILYIFSMLLLLVMVAMNRSFAGVWLVGLGLLLNFLAIAANGGFMPISEAALQQVGQERLIAALREDGHYANVALMTTESRLTFLGDSLIINLPIIRSRVFSVGDLVIALGAFVLVTQAMFWRRRWGRS